MARISEWPNAGPLDGTEQVPVIQGGQNRRGRYPDALSTVTADLGTERVLAYDTFKRTHGDPLGTSDSGHTWTNFVGSHTISQGSFASGDGTQPAVSAVNVGAYSVDVMCRASRGALSRDVGVVFGVDALNYIYVTHSSGNPLRIYQAVDGVSTQLSSVGASANNSGEENLPFEIRMLVVVRASTIEVRGSWNRHNLSSNVVISDPVAHAALSPSTYAGITSAHSSSRFMNFIVRNAIA